MTRKLFLYKCNTKGHAAQRAVGDWRDFFDQAQAGSWGGRSTMASPLSRKILRDEMNLVDLVLCWQTDLRAAVGLCRVESLRSRGRDREIWLELVGDPFATPVQFTERKHSNAVLAGANCLKPGGGTLFRTTHLEAVEILKACGLPKLLLSNRAAPVAAEPTPPPSQRKGSGFGNADQNKLVEEAAVQVLKRTYCAWELVDRGSRTYRSDMTYTRQGVDRDAYPYQHRLPGPGTQPRPKAEAGSLDL